MKRFSSILAVLPILICAIIVAVSPIQAQIHINCPDGAEEFRQGDLIPVLWTVTPSSASVNVLSSSDSGATWQVIASNIVGGRFLWRVPNQSSANFLIKVSGGMSLPFIIQNLTDHNGTNNAAEFNPDGSMFATVGGDKVVHLWSVATGTIIRTLTGHTGIVHRISFSSDMKYLASGGYDGKAIIWDLATGLAVRTMLDTGASTVKFTPDSKSLIIGTNNGEIHVINVANGVERIRFRAHVGEIRHLSVSSDGKYVLTADIDGTAGMFDISSGATIQTFQGHTGTVNGVDITKDGQIVVTASYDYTVKIWNANTGILIRTISGFSDKVSEVKMNPNDSTFIAAGLEGKAKMYNVRTGALVGTLDAGITGNLGAIFNNDGTMVATTYQNGHTVLWGLLLSDISDRVFSVSDCNKSGIRQEGGDISKPTKLDLQVKPNEPNQ